MSPRPSAVASCRFRWVGLALLLAPLVGLTLLLPPIPQPDAYHRFADQRSLKLGSAFGGFSGDLLAKNSVAIRQTIQLDIEPLP